LLIAAVFNCAFVPIAILSVPLVIEFRAFVPIAIFVEILFFPLPTGTPLIETVPAVPVLCVVSVAFPDVSQAIARREYASDGDVEYVP
jgi:hypothetical protein